MEDFEVKEAKDEAAEALTKFSLLCMLSFAEGTSPARTRQQLMERLAEFEPVEDRSGVTPTATVPAPDAQGGPPHIADCEAVVHARLRKNERLARSIDMRQPLNAKFKASRTYGK